jgi:hypothetical protein
MLSPNEINPCNCDNGCNRREDYSEFGSRCPFNGYDFTARQISIMTMRCGCLYHPLAKSVINDVQR